MIAINTILLLIFCFVLIKAVDVLIAAVSQLAQTSHLAKFTLSSLVLAVATSLPELAVSVSSAFAGKSNIALGTVIGSNIADISLVIGGAAIIGGGFSVAGEWLKLDILNVFLAGALPLVLLLDSALSRADGIILILVFGFYNFGLLRRRGRDNRIHGRLLQAMKNKVDYRRAGKLAVKFVLATLALIVAAEVVVKTSTAIATSLNISVFLIGLFLVAIGTSLPELSFEMESIRKRQVGMALGDLFGSVVANSTLILGLVALINPIRLTNGLQEYALAAAVFGIVFLLFWILVRSKKKLEWWEGLILVAAYLVFAAMEFNR